MNSLTETPGFAYCVSEEHVRVTCFGCGRTLLQRPRKPGEDSRMFRMIPALSYAWLEAMEREADGLACPDCDTP